MRACFRVSRFSFNELAIIAPPPAQSFSFTGPMEQQKISLLICLNSHHSKNREMTPTGRAQLRALFGQTETAEFIAIDVSREKMISALAQKPIRRSNGTSTTTTSYYSDVTAGAVEYIMLYLQRSDFQTVANPRPLAIIATG